MTPAAFDVWSRYVARTQRPIVAGPWRDEVGSEVLYWLPFLAQWQHHYGIPSKRIVAVSRGGSSAWYGAAKAIELLDYWPQEVVRLETQRASATTGSVKQTRVSALERVLYPTIAARLGLRRYHVLHPQVMYQSLTPWFAGQSSLQATMNQLRFGALPVPPIPLDVALPEKFVCVQFYERHTWPFTDEVKDWCGQVVAKLAEQTPVVVIGSSAHHDDHLNLAFHGPNITSVMDAFSPRESLAQQSAVISKSSGFVGTYGGTMQLAVRLGKPSAGFFLKWGGTAYAHKVLTEYLATLRQQPCFIGRPQDGDFIRSVLSQPLEMPVAVGSSSGVTG